MYLSLRVKILSVLFLVIAALGFVFNESATRLIVEKTEEIFQERVDTLLSSIRSYWEAEKNQVLRSATLFSESDKLVNYSVYGLTNLLQKEMHRVLANSGYHELRLHLKTGLILSTRALPVFGPPIVITNPRMTLSRLDISVIGDRLILGATVPIFKTEEFIGYLTLQRELDDNRMRRMSRNLIADVTVAVRETVLASSLGGQARQDLAAAIGRQPDRPERIFTLRLAGVSHSIGQIELGETVDKQSFRIYCATSQERMLAMVSSARGQTFGITVLALAVALLISFLFSEKVLLGRIRQVRDGAQRLSQGDLSFRLPERGRDELGDLAGSFNEMGAALLSNREHIQQTIDRLEALKTYIQNILSSLSTSVITFDRSGRVETANGAAQRELAGVFPPEPGLP
ncbi:MAG TPA: HAMP domain-containing protein, partial [Candidatus Ozemobacteraceae bacterium]